jgi:hypothetical protein
MLGADRKPVFTGAGHKITSDYRDDEGRSIAPHLYNRRFDSAGGDEPVSCVVLKDGMGVDAYEVCLADAAFNGDGTSTWTYRVRELETGNDLSHWNLKLHPGQQVLAGTTPRACSPRAPAPRTRPRSSDPPPCRQPATRPMTPA